MSIIAVEHDFHIETHGEALYSQFFGPCYNVIMESNDGCQRRIGYLDKSKVSDHWRVSLAEEELHISGLGEIRYASYIICDSYEDGLLEFVKEYKF